MARLINKKKRDALLNRQDQCCTLCKNTLPDSKSACYDAKSNTLTCRRCALYINSVRTGFDNGITFETFVAFEEQTPQENPALKTDRRQCVEDGRLLYDDPDGPGRPYRDWKEALVLNPSWAEAEERLNN